MAENRLAPNVVDGIAHLRAAGTSLVLDIGGPRIPRVLHWGADLGDLTGDDLRAVVSTSIPQVVSSTMDAVTPFSLVPEPAVGWMGTPGLSGHREGRDFSASFDVVGVRFEDAVSPVAHRIVVDAVDKDVRLGLVTEVEMTLSGLVRLRTTLTNTDDALSYQLDEILLALPVPTAAQEILDFSGRHLRERSPQRHSFTLGTHQRDNRRGRTGADATLLLLAGTPGFSFGEGEVWGLHVAWSGNHRTLAERTPQGIGFLAGGELLLPGEGRLAPGAAYSTPWVIGAWGRGLDAVSARFHDYLRARPQHPSGPRPVVLNTWEAVYFQQDLATLTALADRAAEVGVERFVLDDGWFRHRRDDFAGLGDWYVDEGVWPDGLGPLVDHVRARGMQFGLWFEPEMINVDSDLARAHPEWILSAGYRLPPEARHQQVLDLAAPDAFAHILERMSSLIAEYGIDYLKWDHNRDLVDAGRSEHGRAGVHEQTEAVYRLVDALKARHPDLEIESCSSGGARADLGMLERTDRIWASDCIDPLERRQIDRWSGLLLPPEMIGSHVASPVSHSTRRTHVLSFRAGTALFGHFGIEWDLSSASAEERTELAAWVALYKQHRALLHTGRVVRVDHQDPAIQVHGVVSHDGDEALFAMAALTTSVCAPTGLVRFPGLDPDARYRLTPVPLAARVPAYGADGSTPWWTTGAVLPGRVLAEAGVQMPAIFPEHLVLVHLTRI